MQVIEKSKLKNGVVVQLRQGKKSVGFTIHTDMSLQSLKKTIIDGLQQHN